MSYSSTVLSDSPVAYWRLGESAGATTAADNTGNGHSGTYTSSPSLGTTGPLVGDSDTAMTVTGTQYASVASGAWFGSLTSYSVEVWFRTTAAGNNAFVTYDNSGQSPGHATRVFLFYLSGGKVIFLPIMSSGTYVVVQSPLSYNDNNWHHAVATWNGTTAILYVDGSSVASTAISGTTTSGGAQPILIGTGSNNAIGNYLQYSGDLDEAALYTTALSAARVSAHYLAGLDDGLAPTISDVVPYTENGNLHLLFLLSQGYGVSVSIAVTGDLTQSFGPISNPQRSHISLTSTTLGNTYNLTLTPSNSYGTGPTYNVTYTHTANGFIDAVMQDTPAVYHLTDETSGVRAYDRSLNDRDGTYSGTLTLNDAVDPGVGATQIAKHARLDGSTGHIRLDNGSWMTPATGFSFEGLFYFRSMPTWSRVFDFAASVNTVDFLLAAPASTQLRFYNTGSSSVTSALGDFPLNTWTYLAVTISATGTVTIYVNGFVSATGSVGAVSSNTRASRYIGRSNNTGDPYLPASVAHFAVYNQVLTRSRLDAHFNALGFPRANVQLSRDSVTALTQDSTTTRQMSRSSIGVLTNDTVVNRYTSRISLQVLIPTQPRYRGWGIRR